MSVCVSLNAVGNVYVEGQDWLSGWRKEQDLRGKLM